MVGITLGVENIRQRRTLQSVPSRSLGSLGREDCCNRHVWGYREDPPRGTRQRRGAPAPANRGVLEEGKGVWQQETWFTFEWCALYPQKWERRFSYVDGYQDFKGQYLGKVPFQNTNMIQNQALFNLKSWWSVHEGGTGPNCSSVASGDVLRVLINPHCRLAQGSVCVCGRISEPLKFLFPSSPSFNTEKLVVEENVTVSCNYGYLGDKDEIFRF